MRAIESHTGMNRRDVSLLSGLIFLQMLPATMLTPAIRPLFAALHGGHDGPMHAFMALNMLGAVLLVPWIARRAERGGSAFTWLVALLALDGVTLPILSLPLPIPWLLGMRTLEGCMHVGAASLLMAQVANQAPPERRARAMGTAGAALMLSVAVGNFLGGLCVSVSPTLPFWLAGAIELTLATFLFRRGAGVVSAVAVAPTLTRLGDGGLRELWVPLSGAFVARFTVGCLIVTFSLFLHHTHHAVDGSTGYLLGLLTLPFAMSVYPMTRLSEHMPRSLLMCVGAALYACVLGMLGRVSMQVMPFVMVLGGIASGMLFSPMLCYASTLSGPRKERAMAMFNVAGCLGMLLGPAAAGITAAMLGSESRVAGYRAVFTLASAAVGVWLVVVLPWAVKRAKVELNAIQQPTQCPMAAPPR